MATLVIPVLQSLDYSQRVDLDGKAYLFRLYFNTRNQSWYVDISDSTGVLVAAGRRCIISDVLTGQLHHLAIPPGEFLVFDTLNRDKDPGLADFGGRVLLLYVPKADADAVLLS